jgi:hypothetical protein
MESNYSFGGHRERRDDRILLAALLIAYETISEPGMTEERKRQIARGVLCEFCHLNMPLENGHHVILGVEVPCDAERTPEDDLNTDDLPFAALAAATNDYPAPLLQARRAWWQKQIVAKQDAIDAIPNTEYGSRAWLAGCDEVDGDSDVSEEQDQRNSRPFPY